MDGNFGSRFEERGMNFKILVFKDVVRFRRQDGNRIMRNLFSRQTKKFGRFDPIACKIAVKTMRAGVAVLPMVKDDDLSSCARKHERGTKPCRAASDHNRIKPLHG